MIIITKCNFKPPNLNVLMPIYLYCHYHQYWVFKSPLWTYLFDRHCRRKVNTDFYWNEHILNCPCGHAHLIASVDVKKYVCLRLNPRHHSHNFRTHEVSFHPNRSANTSWNDILLWGGCVMPHASFCIMFSWQVLAPQPHLSLAPWSSLLTHVPLHYFIVSWPYVCSHLTLLSPSSQYQAAQPHLQAVSIWCHIRSFPIWMSIVGRKHGRNGDKVSVGLIKYQPLLKITLQGVTFNLRLTKAYRLDINWESV